MKKLEFSVFVVTAIKNTGTSSCDETLTECMHFHPYFSQIHSTVKIGINLKCMHSVSAAGSSAFYCSPY